jgi:hypothetical protein
VCRVAAPATVTRRRMCAGRAGCVGAAGRGAVSQGQAPARVRPPPCRGARGADCELVAVVGLQLHREARALHNQSRAGDAVAGRHHPVPTRKPPACVPSGDTCEGRGGVSAAQRDATHVHPWTHMHPLQHTDMYPIMRAVHAGIHTRTCTQQHIHTQTHTNTHRAAGRGGSNRTSSLVG